MRLDETDRRTRLEDDVRAMQECFSSGRTAREFGREKVDIFVQTLNARLRWSVCTWPPWSSAGHAGGNPVILNSMWPSSHIILF